MKLPLMTAALLAGSMLSFASGQAAPLIPSSTQKPVTVTPAKASGPAVRVSSGGNNNLLVPPNDDCSAPTAISGAGPHAWDLTTATTGTQNFGGCPQAFFDVWYDWTAGFTGTATVTFCGQGVTNDTVVYVWNGSACPTSGPALACNDDFCGLQSQTTFPAVNGNHYLIQVGVFGGGTHTTGTFRVDPPAPPPPPCSDWDDGTTENLLGWTAGGEMVWLNNFNAATGGSSVSQVRVAWGSALFPGYNPGNGTPVKVAVWGDPNNDGNPTDGSLQALVNTTVANVDTDTYNTINLPSTLNLSGSFFVGAGESHAAGQFVAPMDQNGPNAAGAPSWFFGNNNPTPADYTIITNNAQLPLRFSSIGFPCAVLVRVVCGTTTMTVECQPGQAGVMACPCANPPSGVGRGCNNSDNTGGASLAATGNPSLSSDTVVFTTAGERATSLSIVAQGSSLLASGVVFGQGVRCAGGNLLRLYVKTASGGSITAPQGGDPSVSFRSASLGDVLAPGSVRHYLVYYRDPTVLGGCSPLSTFNATHGGSITWN